MTSTDNIIDAVVMCIYYDYLSTSNPQPLHKMSRSAPAKAAKYIEQLSILQCLFIGVYIVVIALKKKIVEESCLPHWKICTDQRKVWIHQQLVP